MSYFHPDFAVNPDRVHPALLRHHEEAQHRLVSDPVNVAPGGALDPLEYHGGPTLKKIEGVNLYAGTFWDDKTVIDGFTGRVIENGYLEPARGQGTGSGRFLGSFAIPAPSSASITDQDCRVMLTNVIGRNGIPGPDPNRLFMLHLPDGVQVRFTAGGQDVSCGDFCGYHSNAVLGGTPLYYAVHPATTCAGCFQVNPRVGLQMVIAHEIVEAATDPEGTGWFNSQTGKENADEAAWVQDLYGDDITQGYAAMNAAGQWVNSIGTYVAPSQPPPQPPPHFKPSGATAAAWQQLLAGGDLERSELTLLLNSDPHGAAAPAWQYLLNGGDVQALLDSGWGNWFRSHGAA